RSGACPDPPAPDASSRRRSRRRRAGSARIAPGPRRATRRPAPGSPCRWPSLLLDAPHEDPRVLDRLVALVGGGDEARVVIRQDGLGLGLGDLEQDLLDALGERR